MDKLMAEAPRVFTPGVADILPMIAVIVIAIALVGVVLFTIVRHLSRKGSSEQVRNVAPRSESYRNH